MSPAMVPLSVLALAPVAQGRRAGGAAHTRSSSPRRPRARLSPLWIARASFDARIASAATAVALAFVAPRDFDDPHRRGA